MFSLIIDVFSYKRTWFSVENDQKNLSDFDVVHHGIDFLVLVGWYLGVKVAPHPILTYS